MMYVKVPQRIKIFIWLAMHDTLLSNAVRFVKHMATHPNCMVCFFEMEDMDHILCRCPTARGVWQFLRSKDLNCLHPELDVKERFIHNIGEANVDPLVDQVFGQKLIFAEMALQILF